MKYGSIQSLKGRNRGIFHHLPKWSTDEEKLFLFFRPKYWHHPKILRSFLARFDFLFLLRYISCLMNQSHLHTRQCYRLTICSFISDLTISYYCETSRLVYVWRATRTGTTAALTRGRSSCSTWKGAAARHECPRVLIFEQQPGDKEGGWAWSMPASAGIPTQINVTDRRLIAQNYPQMTSTNSLWSLFHF